MASNRTGKQKGWLYPGTAPPVVALQRRERLAAAIERGRVRQVNPRAIKPVGDPHLERERKNWWWINPPHGQPANWEWAWYCWRTRNERLDRRDRVEAAKDAPKAPAGATAGWRRPNSGE